MTTRTKAAKQAGTADASTTTAWKFLRERDGALYSQHGDMRWEIGAWQSVSGPLELCGNGLHCSTLPLDALRFVHGEVVAEVECAGEHLDDSDKAAWQQMRVVRAWRWSTQDSVRLAIRAAESVIELFEAQFPGDERPRQAIEAAKRYLDSPNDAAYAARAAAYAAAYAAARAAAYAADAARAAAYAAAYAARAAAYAAAYAARAAADAAADAARAAADAAAYAADAARAAADAARAAADADHDAAWQAKYREVNDWVVGYIREQCAVYQPSEAKTPGE